MHRHGLVHTRPACIGRGWLREGILAGAVGAPWEGDFPRYVWCEKDGVWYEGRLVNREQGTYKGYELKPSELPRGL